MAAPERPRGEARDAALRAGIAPLADGERPAAIVVAAAFCALIGAANLVLWVAGPDVDRRPSAGVVIAFALVAFAAAWGLWHMRYGVVLAFQAVLAATIIVAGLSVMVAGNALAVGLCAVVMVLGGWLFWKLVRVLARLQAPGRGEGDVTS